jgi:hypothetical protein
MKDRELMEIPLDDRDAELLPPLHEYLKSTGPVPAGNRVPNSSAL